MCLLITGSSKQIRGTLLDTEGLLLDIFKSNEDGVGAMFASVEGLHTPKALPKNFGECKAFIEALPDDDRSLAIHFRMRTHGATDLENCHPYPVINGIAMMHNGVLQQGNAADKTKSDTWHYVNDVVRPMLSEAPTMFMNKAWMELVENDIGSGNRFAIMDQDGNLAVLNKDTGIMVGDLWFSNTYAWDPALLIPGYRKATSYSSAGSWRGHSYGGYGSYLDYDDEDETPSYQFDADDVWEAISRCDIGEVTELLLAAPVSTLVELFDECEFVPYEGPLSKDDEDIVKELVDHEIMRLVNRAKTGNGATSVAQVIAWYGDWVGLPKDQKGRFKPETRALAADADEKIREEGKRRVEQITSKKSTAKLLDEKAGQDLIDMVRQQVDEHMTADTNDTYAG